MRTLLGLSFSHFCPGPVVAMELAVLRDSQLLCPSGQEHINKHKECKEYFNKLQAGGKTFPPIVNQPPGNTTACARASSLASWPAYKFDSIYCSFCSETDILPPSGVVMALAETC